MWCRLKLLQILSQYICTGNIKNFYNQAFKGFFSYLSVVEVGVYIVFVGHNYHDSCHYL